MIDVKEPRNGSLGRAPVDAIEAITKLISPKKPVSAALGELGENLPLPALNGLSYVKWGLAGCGRESDWRRKLLVARQRICSSLPNCDVVAVAYADWQQAGAPPSADVCEFACTHAFKVLLIDTWTKDGRTLLDWLAIDDILSFVHKCRTAGLRIALAGKLGKRAITILRSVEPDWFAVRSSVCRQGKREQAIDPDAVRALVNLINGRSNRPLAKVDNAYVQAGRGPIWPRV